MKLGLLLILGLEGTTFLAGGALEFLMVPFNLMKKAGSLS
jgi:hypothetical protein